jgi:BMFP domain-containing protein YqiC
MSGDSIETLARRLAEAVPEGLKSVGEDLEQNFRSVLRAGLGKLDLVTREEFEVQEAVLERSREMLEALEERLKALETVAVSPPARKKTAKKASKKKSGKKSAG